MRAPLAAAALLAACAARAGAAVVGPAEAGASARPLVPGAPAPAATPGLGGVPLLAPALFAAPPSSPLLVDAPAVAKAPAARPLAPAHLLAAASLPVAAPRAAAAPSAGLERPPSPSSRALAAREARAPSGSAPAPDARPWSGNRAEYDALFDGSAARPARSETAVPASGDPAAARPPRLAAPSLRPLSPAAPSSPAPLSSAGVEAASRPWWLLPRQTPQLLSMSVAAALAGVLAAGLVALVAAAAGGPLGLGPVLAGSGQVTGLFMGLVANGLFSLSLFPYYLASVVHEYGHYAFARWAGIEAPGRYRDFQDFGPGQLSDEHAPIYPRDRRQHAWWLLGGPAFNLAAGGVSLAAAAVLGTILGPATHALNFLFVTLLVWALWNLTMGIGALLPIREGRGGHRILQVLAASDDARYVTKTRSQLRREWARWRASRKRALPDFYP